MLTFHPNQSGNANGSEVVGGLTGVVCTVFVHKFVDFQRSVVLRISPDYLDVIVLSIFFNLLVIYKTQTKLTGDFWGVQTSESALKRISESPIFHRALTTSLVLNKMYRRSFDTQCYHQSSPGQIRNHNSPFDISNTKITDVF
jgi:hypothetical protein